MGQCLGPSVFLFLKINKFRVNFVVYAKFGDQPEEDLARFGYK
jgi:hypothetical protein